MNQHVAQNLVPDSSKHRRRYHTSEWPSSSQQLYFNSHNNHNRLGPELAYISPFCTRAFLQRPLGRPAHLLVVCTRPKIRLSSRERRSKLWQAYVRRSPAGLPPRWPGLVVDRRNLSADPSVAVYQTDPLNADHKGNSPAYCDWLEACIRRLCCCLADPITRNTAFSGHDATLHGG